MVFWLLPFYAALSTSLEPIDYLLFAYTAWVVLVGELLSAAEVVEVILFIVFAIFDS